MALFFDVFYYSIVWDMIWETGISIPTAYRNNIYIYNVWVELSSRPNYWNMNNLLLEDTHSQEEAPQNVFVLITHRQEEAPQMFLYSYKIV